MSRGILSGLSASQTESGSLVLCSSCLLYIMHINVILMALILVGAVFVSTPVSWTGQLIMGTI